VDYKINLRFRRFSCGTGQITGLTAYYIAPRPHDAPRGSANSRAQYESAALSLIRAIAAIAPKGTVLRAYQDKSAWKPNIKKQK
jgi:hypothetical protein